jgi:4,5-DOPA dioxygenase extradiol
VQQFDEWLADTIAQRDWNALIHYRQLAPYAQGNHPTEENLLPLFVALGIAGVEAKGTPLHHSYTYGVFSMAAYGFTAATLDKVD